jgi:alanyl-tRNA synthetase
VGIAKGETLISSALEGDEAELVLDTTPFYAESGGQVGDTGWISGEEGEALVTDTQKEAGYYLHHVKVTAGGIHLGDEVNARIDADRRMEIRRNHSATHLLHKALQSVLGSHVQQRGSLVGPDKLRFDFSHDKAMSEPELRAVEALVNEQVLNDIPVDTLVKPIEEARALGAMMLFGEKYGSIVRVVKMGDYSKEFCGGTHLGHTSQVGLFKITSEGSSQAGVRRLEGVTGRMALMKTLETERIVSDAAAMLKTNPSQLVAGLERLQGELRAKDRELSSLHRAAAGSLVEALEAGAEHVGGVGVVAKSLGENGDADTLRTVADELIGRLKSGVVILAGSGGGKVALAVKVSKDLVGKGLHAGELVKAAARIVGGGGGGRPDFAQAGGKIASKIPEALETAHAMAREKLEGKS